MRISDWRSDVCSSDLEPRDRARNGRGHAVRSRLSLALFRDQRREAQGRARGPLYSHPREEAVQPAGPHSAAGAGGSVERKRGVEGKGESVRVDLGGRRFIKKKNKDRTES